MLGFLEKLQAAATELYNKDRTSPVSDSISHDLATSRVLGLMDYSR